MNDRPGMVRRASRAFAQAPDTRALKRELRSGNHYAHELLARRGLAYRDGAIQAAGVEVEARALRVGDVLVDEGEVREVYWPPIPNTVAVAAGDDDEKPYLTFRPTAKVLVLRRK